MFHQHGVKMSKQVKKTIKKKNNLNIWLILGGLALIIFAVAVGFSPKTADKDVVALPLEVSVTEAYQMREEGAFVLDVREPHEWEAGHIPDATLIPLGQLESRLNEIPDDQEILVVCRSGNRSAQARNILKNEGFKNVTSMAGGMNQWAANSYEIETGQ
jgi:rhodanese-related sulfurtransferase